MSKVDKIADFQRILKKFYIENKREMPWREADEDGMFDPYKILVSEIMLQQTQVPRVEKYYPEFLKQFPDLNTLANAKLESVLASWKGLGYNRRALYLRNCAQAVRQNYNGRLPTELNELIELPGIGKNTAGAILAYAYNIPVPFVETNVRTVYLYHFFNDRTEVKDSEILELVAKTINKHSPREFYWALMDYGTYLKSHSRGINERSAQYSKQSKFEGSSRQLRARLLFELATGPVDEQMLIQKFNDSRISVVLASLKKDKMIDEKAGQLFIAS